MTLTGSTLRCRETSRKEGRKEGARAPFHFEMNHFLFQVVMTLAIITGQREAKSKREKKTSQQAHMARRNDEDERERKRHARSRKRDATENEEFNVDYGRITSTADSHTHR